MKFTKWQGCGNDFVLIDCTRGQELDFPALSRRLCDRHYGIGADGLVIVLPSEKAAFRMRIFNTDGSEAEMCGNGIRCFARYLHDYGLTQAEEFTVETGAGILRPRLLWENGQLRNVRVDMGEPILAGDLIPVRGYGMGQVVSQPIDVAGVTYKMTCVSMGNPHCVIFVADAENFPVAQVGRALEKHPIFPQRTNVEFVTVKDGSNLRMRVWERGAAITMACGTGSCASVVAASLLGFVPRCARVGLDGGSLLVEWADDNHVYMTGPAEQVFSGEVAV